MKMLKYLMFAAVAVAAISCTKEAATPGNETGTNLIPMTFTTGDAESKVAYENGATVWKVGDKIQVIASTGTATEFTATSIDDGGKKATFEGLSENAETYYAVSPASAYVGNDIANGKIYANVPETQTAVAGTFDPKAFLSVASSAGGTLYFKNSCSVIGFKLQNPANIKSVRFIANAQTNIAGTGVINTDAIPTHSWDGTYAGRSSFNMITLNAPEEGFIADTDYYMTIRSNKCPDGITVYIEYNDQIKSRTSSSTLFPDGSLNRVRNLGTLDVNLTDILPYDEYMLGLDLVIGDKVYNKAVNGDAVKVTADGTSMYTAFNKGGIRFLEPAADGAIVLHSNVAVTADAVLVGNVNSGKVLIDMNGKNVNHTAKTIALKNLELDTDAYTNYVFANNDATADADAFILDNCSVTGLVKPLWYVNVAGYTLKEVTIVNTDIALGGGTNIIDLSKTTSLGNELISVKNCILYGASNYVSRIVNNTSNITEWTADVVFENNTVYNLHAGTDNGLLHMVGANSVTFKNNLVNFYSLNTKEHVIRIWKNTPTYSVENNHFWARAAAGIPSDLTFYSNVMVKAASANITSGAYPFTSNISGAGATR